ncbi:hypothetical protein ACUNWD_03835 [Sunxiuqinia sp. A32]|uniref:hypothetical protein n=1 Tax=Sunxiuqinia sp. A32 TaxID=3461496 RepID=UPI0040462DE4
MEQSHFENWFCSGKQQSLTMNEEMLKKQNEFQSFLGAGGQEPFIVGIEIVADNVQQNRRLEMDEHPKAEVIVYQPLIKSKLEFPFIVGLVVLIAYFLFK